MILQTRASVAGDRLGTLVLGVLLAAAALNIGLALVVINRPDEVRYGEAILYEHAGRLLRGEALYQPLNTPPYTVAAYTPLYYGLVAGLRAVLGPGFWPGRLLSFGAGLVATALVCQLTWRRTHHRRPTLGAGLLFLGLGLVGPIPWTAAYKEDVLGVALALGAVAVLDGGVSRGRVVTSALLAALAILTKQTLLGPAVIGTLWLGFRQPRLAALYAAVAFGPVLGVAVILELTTHAFIANTVLANVNPFGLDVLRYNLVVFALFQTGPLLVLVSYLLPRLRPRSIVNDLLIGAWVVSLVPMLGLAKEGADDNYWQLFAAFSAVLVMLALWERRGRLSGALSSFAVGLNVALALMLLSSVAVNEPGQVHPSPAADGAFEHLVALARAAPGAVLADPLDMPVLADRPIVLEPVIYKLLYQVGLWDAAPLVQRVCNGEVALLVLRYPLGSGTGLDVAADADHQWPGPVLDALRRTFVLQEVVAAGGGQRFVYVPDATRAACSDRA
ncbi:MAG TPA: hypothetical protein VKV73_15105 [Chloroflexota bacterium]|nr:hypothetical protein [Chloroflexota bacterium]